MEDITRGEEGNKHQSLSLHLFVLQTYTITHAHTKTKVSSRRGVVWKKGGGGEKGTICM